jgi:hypothetical protein
VHPLAGSALISTAKLIQVELVTEQVWSAQLASPPLLSLTLAPVLLTTEIPLAGEQVLAAVLSPMNPATQLEPSVMPMTCL